MKQLKDTIAVITGASRGIGRGIAHELGLAGATVYVTGRSRASGPRTEDLPGTIDEVAELVTQAGGQGIAVACDHTRDDDVDRLAATIRQGHGRVDILVNNVWGGYESYDVQLFEAMPWEQPVWRWDKMMATGVRAHYITTRALLPLLVAAGKRLMVNISAGDDGRFLGDVQYDVAKAAIDRLAFAMARKLRRQGVVALSIHPGFTRTERVERHAPAEELAATHSPRFVGRAVVALASDPGRAERSGGVYKVAHLGRDYGFTDIDGSQPEPFCLPPDFDG